MLLVLLAGSMAPSGTLLALISHLHSEGNWQLLGWNLGFLCRFPALSLSSVHKEPREEKPDLAMYVLSANCSSRDIRFLMRPHLASDVNEGFATDVKESRVRLMVYRCLEVSRELPGSMCL